MVEDAKIRNRLEGLQINKTPFALYMWCFHPWKICSSREIQFHSFGCMNIRETWRAEIKGQRVTNPPRARVNDRVFPISRHRGIDTFDCSWLQSRDALWSAGGFRLDGRSLARADWSARFRVATLGVLVAPLIPYKTDGIDAVYGIN